MRDSFQLLAERVVAGEHVVIVEKDSVAAEDSFNRVVRSLLETNHVEVTIEASVDGLRAEVAGAGSVAVTDSAKPAAKGKGAVKADTVLVDAAGEPYEGAAVKAEVASENPKA